MRYAIRTGLTHGEGRYVSFINISETWHDEDGTEAVRVQVKLSPTRDPHRDTAQDLKSAQAMVEALKHLRDALVEHVKADLSKPKKRARR